MKKRSFRKFVVLSIFGAACTTLNTGCQFVEDVVYGFALAVGAIPAQLVGDLVGDVVAPPAE
jgi:hypothetical protein